MENQTWADSRKDEFLKRFSEMGLTENQRLMIKDCKDKASDLGVVFSEIEHEGIDSGEAMRLLSIAITHLETSVMFATKAISRI